MLLVRFDSFTRLALALPASWALAAGVGTTIPVFAVSLTIFFTWLVGTVLATAARFAVRFAAVLTNVFLAAALLVVALLVVGLAAAGLVAGAAAGLAVAALREVVLAVLLRVFLTPCNSVRAACRDTLALAVRCLGVSFFAVASTVVTVEAFAKAAS